MAVHPPLVAGARLGRCRRGEFDRLHGVLGKGKSALAKSLATRSIAFGRRVYVPGDPKGEWTDVSRAVGGVAIQIGGGGPNRLNPLDPGPRASHESDQQWAATMQARRRALLGS